MAGVFSGEDASGDIHLFTRAAAAAARARGVVFLLGCEAEQLVLAGDGRRCGSVCC